MLRELETLPPPQSPQIVDNFSGKNALTVHNFSRNFAHSKKPNKYRYLRIMRVTYNGCYVKCNYSIIATNKQVSFAIMDFILYYQ